MTATVEDLAKRTDERFNALIAAQRHTDDRLNALITVVDGLIRKGERPQ